MTIKIKPSDLEILDLLSTGLTFLEIAEEKGYSERQIRRKIARLKRIIGAINTFMLGVWFGKHETIQYLGKNKH